MSVVRLRDRCRYPESERPFESTHFVYDRSVDGACRYRLRVAVRRMVNPVVATKARQADGCDSSSR